MFRSILAGAQKLAVGILLLGFAAAAGAENLTTVKTGTLPTLNDAETFRPTISNTSNLLLPSHAMNARRDTGSISSP